MKSPGIKRINIAIIILVVAILAVAGWIVARATHAIEFYSFGTTANLPGYKPGTVFFASRLKAPGYNNFICFRNNVTRTLFVFRVIGLPGDVIEIKNAEVYRNGEHLNEPFTWNEYLLAQKEYFNIKGYIASQHNDTRQPTDSTYLVALTNAEAKQYKITRGKFTRPKGLPDEQLFPDFRKKGYNADNLGPVTVPAQSYFVLGDDRHNALDSRYLGFISSKDVVSTKIGD